MGSQVPSVSAQVTPTAAGAVRQGSAERSSYRLPRRRTRPFRVIPLFHTTVRIRNARPSPARPPSVARRVSGRRSLCKRVCSRWLGTSPKEDASLLSKYPHVNADELHSPSRRFQAVLVKSKGVASDAMQVKGWDFDKVRPRHVPRCWLLPPGTARRAAGAVFRQGLPLCLQGRDLDGILEAMYTTGYQATSFGQAMREVNRMINWRLSDEAPPESGWEDPYTDPAVRERTGCRIFLGFTSNLISSGEPGGSG